MVYQRGNVGKIKGLLFDIGRKSFRVNVQDNLRYFFYRRNLLELDAG